MITCNPQDGRWIDDRLSLLPDRFSEPVKRRYSMSYQKEGRRAANTYLRGVVDVLPKLAYGLASDDQNIIRFADTRARACDRAASGCEPEAAYSIIKGAIEPYSIKPPEVDGETITYRGAVERLKDPIWWRRAIRVQHGRTVEQVGRNLGLVHKGAGIYSSDETLFRRRGQKTRNRRMLEEVLAVNEEGQEFTIAELSDLSVSNPVIRRGELMTRIAGFETVADDLGHVGEFITLTCPSRFHSHTIVKNGGRVFSVENKKYDGSTPRDAAAYLQGVWARIRAKLARHNVRLYGFRVAEPNHDGCVHWHLLVFMPAWARRRVRHVFTRYGLEDSPKEPGATEHRVTFKAIDKSRGTAAGYIAKYIAKNIDGFGIEADLYGNCSNDAAERVDAWAACWGIRQFQQVGGPPVTVWRELRRIEGEESGILETARDAADKGDWAAFVQAMGGPLCPRSSHPVRVARLADIQTVDESTGELLKRTPLTNRYGEPAAPRVVGVSVGDVIHLTRWREWEIKRGSNENQNMVGELCGAAAGAFSGAGLDQIPGKSGDWKIAYAWDKESGEFGAPSLKPSNESRRELWVPLLIRKGYKISEANAKPWSSVNNCTRKAQGVENGKVEIGNYDHGHCHKPPDSGHG